MRVDEPRSHDQTGRVDGAGRDIDRREVADRKHAIPEDPDVGGPTRRPGAVHDRAAPDEQVEGRHVPMMPSRTGHRAGPDRPGCYNPRSVGL